MTNNPVPVRTFSSRIDADLARELLEQQGIRAYVSADDAGGIDPALQLTQGVSLIVLEHDLARSRRILADEYGE
jgi:hypothetical protein